MSLYSFRLTAAVSPFMAYNRRHRAAISVSLSATVRWDGGGFFFFSINYLQVFIHRPPEGVVHMGLERGGAVAKGKGEKSLAGVLRHIVRHLCLFTARHGCRVHRLISRKDMLMS